MTSITFFLIFVPILGFILLMVNFIFAPHNPYKEKETPFECGYHSFLGQNRIQFTVSFFTFGILFLLFDLEIVLIYPYSVASYANHLFGLITMIIFTLLVTIGFVYELGKQALKIDSRQTLSHGYISLTSMFGGVNFPLTELPNIGYDRPSGIYHLPTCWISWDAEHSCVIEFGINDPNMSLYDGYRPQQNQPFGNNMAECFSHLFFSKTKSIPASAFSPLQKAYLDSLNESYGTGYNPRGQQLSPTEAKGLELNLNLISLLRNK